MGKAEPEGESSDQMAGANVCHEVSIQGKMCHRRAPPLWGWAVGVSCRVPTLQRRGNLRLCRRETALGDRHLYFFLPGTSGPCKYLSLGKDVYNFPGNQRMKQNPEAVLHPPMFRILLHQVLVLTQKLMRRAHSMGTGLWEKPGCWATLTS